MNHTAFVTGEELLRVGCTGANSVVEGEKDADAVDARVSLRATDCSTGGSASSAAAAVEGGEEDAVGRVKWWIEVADGAEKPSCCSRVDGSRAVEKAEAEESSAA